MRTRQSFTTEGKRISFAIDNNYYVIGEDKKKVFDGSFKACKYAVAYTEVKEDCGTIYENRFGVPAPIRYNNGLVGYQSITYFNDRAEAMEDFKGRQKLTPKFMGGDYTDVFFIEND